VNVAIIIFLNLIYSLTLIKDRAKLRMVRDKESSDHCLYFKDIEKGRSYVLNVMQMYSVVVDCCIMKVWILFEQPWE
jgi:hypothetical protein